ncbi:hypothetical protein QL285_005293 [Trifolium repens]|nr:hypothetical protein QL285_005293 [Trifolium repens]
MQGKKTGEKGSNNTGEPPKEWTKEEEQALRDAHEVFGDSWGAILKSNRFKGIFAGRVDYMLRFQLLQDVNCTLVDTVIGLDSANKKLDTLAAMLKK